VVGLVGPVAGKTYSAVLWGTANTGGRPEPAVGSTLTVACNTRYPSVLGRQNGPGAIACAVIVVLLAAGLGFWGNTWYKPYRAEIDAVAAVQRTTTAARRPCPAPAAPPRRSPNRQKALPIRSQMASAWVLSHSSLPGSAGGFLVGVWSLKERLPFTDGRYRDPLHAEIRVCLEDLVDLVTIGYVKNDDCPGVIGQRAGQTDDPVAVQRGQRCAVSGAGGKAFRCSLQCELHYPHCVLSSSRAGSPKTITAPAAAGTGERIRLLSHHRLPAQVRPHRPGTTG